MGNQLTIVKDLTNVGDDLASMLSSASANSVVRKKDNIIVDSALLLFEPNCRALGISQPFRQSIMELSWTLQLSKLQDMMEKCLRWPKLCVGCSMLLYQAYLAET